MSKSNGGSSDGQERVNEDLRLKKTHRHSLQPKSTTDLPLGSLRHTQSHRYDSDGKKRMKKVTVLTPIPSTILDIPEEGEDYEKVIKTEEKKGKKASVAKKIEIKAALAFDNDSYDRNFDSRSVSSKIGSSRASSLQSLEVVREQYCCCAKRTRCERKLLLVITVMSISIIVLVIVIVIVSKRSD